MSFNLDDPLAGILSDGSDDSFFDDDILGKKKPVNKKSTPNVERKNTLFNLDNITTKAKSDKSESKVDTITVNKQYVKPDGAGAMVSENRQDNLSHSFNYTERDKSIKTTGSDNKDTVLSERVENKKSSFKNKVEKTNTKTDFLDELMGPRKHDVTPLEKTKDSQSLLDDILGKSSVKVSQVNKPTNTKNQQYSSDKVKEKSELKESQFLKKPKDQSETISKIEQKKTKSNEDWLGIFQDKSETVEDDSVDVPAWLGGTNSFKRKSMEKDNKSPPIRETENETLVKSVTTNKDDLETKAITESEKDKMIKQNESNFLHHDELHKNDTDVTMQGAALYLQQQEAQLMVAMQLKAQDEKLAAMQMKQKEAQRVQREAALAQHTQLEAMLQRQSNHRLQMQAIINAHQDRIAQRIKALLGSTDTELEEVNEPKNDNENAVQEREDSPRNKEKKQLLQLLQSLQENHDKEIDILETSYRRQLAFLEVSLNQTEERMREESEKQMKFYTEKINWLEEHHRLFKQWTEENTNALIERHNAEKEMLRQQHSENVKGLQEHHTALMENIRNAVKQEQALIRDSAAFSTDIQELVSDVRESKINCQQLVEKVSTMTGNMESEVERNMKVRETQVNDMLEQLKKDREYFEKEKTESKGMIQMLEVRLKQMTTMMEDESASLKKKKMEFEFEKATFNKQTEYAKNVLKKEHEEVKMIKDDIQKEYQEKIAKITEDNARVLKEAALVAKEKASIQSLKMELEKTKTELQAQLEETSEERSKVNMEKNELHMEQQRIMAKGKEIELIAKTAMEKQMQAERKCEEADSQLKKYEERMRRLQEQVVSLNVREKQIAREKIVLSRERISLHNDRKRMESEQQCSLCRSIPRTQHIPYQHAYYGPESAIPKPQYVSHQHNYDAPASRDYGDANVSHAFSSIELEMAQLMGRSLSMKHEPVLTGVQLHGAPRKDPVDNPDGMDDVSTETGVFKDYMDPKFMMLRLDVQKVIHNLGDKDALVNKH